MPDCSPETRRVLAIWLGEGRAGPDNTLDKKLDTGLAALRARHPGARIVLLTTPVHAGAPGADEVWTDGRVRGTSGFLALVRRIAWSRFAAVYDLRPCGRSRIYRYLTRPRPPWNVA